ncbi:MAG: hypothetical protein ACYC64_07170 [Armatimonadota bacterium]
MAETLSRQTTGAVPHHLDTLQEYFAAYPIENDTFDPCSAWENNYSLWFVIPGTPPAAGSTGKGAGMLRIRRGLTNAGEFALDIISTTTALENNKSHKKIINITCDNNLLSTPKRWSLRSCIYYADGQPAKHTDVSISGKVASNVIIRNSAKERKLKAPKYFTSDWSLFDAIQRLSFVVGLPISFDMFEDMDILKSDQKLVYTHSVEINAGRQVIRLHGFEQIGCGILPHYYWLDDQHRLIAAMKGTCAYLLDTSATLPEDKNGR